MAYESIKVDIIPGAENAEVLHFSQYDNKRPFFIELFNGGAEFIPEEGMTITLECRKRDGNIVILSDPVLTDNVAEFSTTEQLTACYGDNNAEVRIVDSDGLDIGSGNFIINVEKSPTCGGLASQSEIDNLTQQIAAIVPEVIGDDYYNKSETDSLLANKANMSDLATLASKAELENAIDEEDRTLKNWAFSQFATPGYIASNYYNKDQVDNLLDNIFPTLSASGPIANFRTALSKPLVSVTTEAGATIVTRCGKNLFDANENNITEGSNICTISGNVITNTGANAYDAVRFEQPLKAGNYIMAASNITENGIIQVSYNDGSYQDLGYMSAISPSLTFTMPANATFRISLYSSQAGGMSVTDLQCEVGSTPSAYAPYNGQTVPVTDATTLTTLSGVNNVFADSGDVTVQYKYLSM